MSLADNDKLALNLRAPQYPVTTLPIKKRPLTLARALLVSLPLQDREEAKSKPGLVDLRSSASTRVSFLESKAEFIVKSDPDKVMGCESLLGCYKGEFLLPLAANSCEDSTLDKKPSFQPAMESAKVQTPPKRSTPLQLGIPHDKPADEKVSSFSEVSSLKYEKSGRNDSERNQGRASRMNLDLNIPLESWSDYTDSSMKKGFCERIQMSSLHLPSEPTRELNRRDKKISGLGLSNVPPSLGQNVAKVSLDLVLKPPCRPGPRFSWLDIGPGKKDSEVEIIDLSLSLVSSCKKPESRDKGIQQMEFDLHDSTSAVLVTPDPCEGGPSNLISGCIGSATSTPSGYSPLERPKGIVLSNSISDCFDPIKSVPPDYPHHEHPIMGIGEASRGKVSSYDRKSASVKEVPQLLCGNVRDFYTNSDNSGSSLVKEFYSNKLEIDLNSPPIDSDNGSVEANEMLAEVPPEVVSQDQCTENNETQEPDDGSNAHTDSGILMEESEMLAEVPPEVVSQDHCELPETSPFLKDGAAKSSKLVSKLMELEQEELNSPEDVNGADGLKSVVSQGNKPTTPDALSEDDSKTAALDGNDSIPSMLTSDDVAEIDEDGAMEGNENGNEAESDEENENENGDTAESDEEIGEYDYEEVIEEASCDDESDGSHDAAGAGDTDFEEYEEVIEVSCDNDSDSSTHHDAGAQYAGFKLYSPHKNRGEGEAVQEVRGQREASTSHDKEGANSVPATSPTIGPTQGDVIGEDIQSSDECTKMRQSSDLDMKITIEKRPLSASSKTDQDWETKPGCNISIVEAAEVDNSKQGLGSWETKSGLNKNIAEPTKGGNAKRGTKSTLKKDSVEGTAKGNTKQGWGTWGTKSEDSNKKRGRGSWEMKSGPNKDIADASEKGRHDAGRRENVRRRHCSPYGDARRHEGPFKRSRIINLNNGSDRSSYGKEKSDYARPNRPHAERERFFGNKSFMQDKPHPGWHKDGRRNDRFHRPEENDSNQSYQFGMRRSDYTWVRKDDGKNDDALHRAGQYPNIEDAPEYSYVSSSRGQLSDTREEQTQPGSQMTNYTIRNASPSGRYSGRNTPDFQAPEAREGRAVVRDLPSSSAGHHSFSHHNQQYVLQTENPWTNATFRSAPRSLENSPQPWLGSEHKEMQPYQQHAYYLQNREREINPNGLLQYNTNHPQQAHEETTSTYNEREINPNGLQYNTNHPQQAHEETFRRPQYNHYGEQEHTAPADFLDERDYAVLRSHPRPPYGGREHTRLCKRGRGRGRGRGVSDRNIRNRLGDTSNGEQTVDAEYGFENGPRPRYGQEVHDNLQDFPDERDYAVRRSHPRPPYGGREIAHFHERGRGRGVSDGNIRNRLGDTLNGEQTVGAEYGFENGQDVHDNLQEGGNLSKSGGNIRNRLGGRGASQGARRARSGRGRGGNFRFNNREAWHDAESSEARVKRRKY